MSTFDWFAGLFTLITLSAVAFLCSIAIPILLLIAIRAIGRAWRNE